MSETFMTSFHKEEGMDATGITVPEEVIAALGAGKRPPVKVTIQGYTYRTTVAVYGDVYMIGIAQDHRAKAGVNAGDTIQVTLELDTEPGTVEVHTDLAAALAAKPGARAAFDALACSIRKEHVRQVETAKAPETRERRISKIVDQLGS